MKNNKNKKVILAFSGGLDTSFCVPYLIDKEFDVITVTIDSGGLNPEDITEIEKKSKELGATKHYLIDAKQYYYDSIISWIIKIGLLIVPILPLVITKSLYFPFITGRNFIFRIIVEIIFVL